MTAVLRLPLELKAQINYSEKFKDAQFEYRFVALPRSIAKDIPNRTDRLLPEKEWRELGIIQSHGWEHYTNHRPQPHILVFRRPLCTDPRTGNVDARELKQYRQEANMKRNKFIKRMMEREKQREMSDHMRVKVQQRKGEMSLPTSPTLKVR